MINIQQVIELREKEFDYLLNKDDVSRDMVIATKVIRDNNIWLIDGIIYSNVNGKWVKENNAGDSIIETINKLSQVYLSYMKLNQRNIIAKEIKMMLENEAICPEFQLDKNLIYFNNGCFDLFKNEFTAIDKNEILKLPFIKFDFDWNEKIKYDQILLDLLNWWSLGDEFNKRYLLQMLGAIISGFQVQQIFNFYGAEGSGKSLIIKLIARIIGEENVISTTINSLNQRFGTLQILRKKLIVESDASTTEAIQPEMIKKITGGDTIQFEFKGGGFQNKTLQTNVLITSNVPLIFKGDFEGLNRRLLIYNFPYTAKNFDPEIVDFKFFSIPIGRLNKIREFVNGSFEFKIKVLIPLVIDALKAFSQVIINDFTFDETVSMKAEKYRVNMNSDNVLRFYDELSKNNEFLTYFTADFDRKIYYAKSADLFEVYKKWIFQNQLKPFSHYSFRSKLANIVAKDRKVKVYESKHVNNIRNFVIEFTREEGAQAWEDFIDKELNNEN